MDININQIIKKLEKKAKSIYLDKDKLKGLLNSTKRMIEENQQLKDIVEDVSIMVQLVKDRARGDYKDLSKNSIILVVSALLYLVIPLDVIPDFLPLGFIDDMAVIAFVMKKMSSEMDKYKIWKGISSEISIESPLEMHNDYEEIIDAEYEDYFDI